MLDEIKNGDGLVTKLIEDTTYAATFEKALNNVAEVERTPSKCRTT